MRVVIVIAAIVLAAAHAPAWADRAGELRAAEQLLADGSHAEAGDAAASLLLDPALLPAERAQAQRIRGLALFYQGKNDEAEAAMREYLRLEPEAHLNPALVQPEAVVFFESVRTRYAGEILTVKPRPRRKRSLALNFLPPFGQFQNGDRTKGWLIAGGGVVLLAANLTTYAMLSSSCDSSNLTCDRDPSSARTLRVVNLASGAMFLALYGYGVIDGLVHFRGEDRKPGEVARPWSVSPILGWGPEPMGVQAAFSF